MFVGVKGAFRCYDKGFRGSMGLISEPNKGEDKEKRGYFQTKTGGGREKRTTLRLRGLRTRLFWTLLDVLTIRDIRVAIKIQSRGVLRTCKDSF